MDYEIHTHKDFATTRFVLEEDNNNIPLMEIAVGEGADAKPHLIVNKHGEFADALSKLKRIAGEGNYIYGVMGFNERGETSADDGEAAF